MFSKRFAARLVLYFASLAVLAYGGWSLLGKLRFGDEPEGPLAWEVRREAFLHEIVEKGELESGDNVEVRCQVKRQGRSGGGGGQRRGGASGGGGSSGSGGTGSGSGDSQQRDSGAQFTILEVVPEGTRVKAGDFLALLDASALKEELLSQQIECSSAEASLIQAQNRFDVAEISLKEYVEGTHLQRQKALSDEVALQTETVRQSNRNFDLTYALFLKGYTTRLQIEADHFASQRNQVQLQQAKTSLNCLETYTHVKTLAELNAAIAVAKSRLETEQKNYELAVADLADLESQIKKCEIRAPIDGTVVYANKTGMDLRGAEVIIEAGTSVRDGQPIIRLPNPQSMQVKVLIDEANLAFVQPGQPARFTLDGLPEIELYGFVTKVNDYPEPSADPFMGGSSGQYEATVSIDNPPLNLRTGMTAEVRIRISLLRDQLQVPCSAVIQHGNKQYCLVLDGSALRAREVKTGSSNGKFTIIEDGLEAGTRVVLGASMHLDKVDLPRLPAGPKAPGSLFADGEGQFRSGSPLAP